MSASIKVVGKPDLGGEGQWQGNSFHWALGPAERQTDRQTEIRILAFLLVEAKSKGVLNLKPQLLKCPKEPRAGCSWQALSQREGTWRGARPCGHVR